MTHHKSARPRGTNGSVKCIRCNLIKHPLTSTNECRDCNPTKFYHEYSPYPQRIK